MSVLTRVTARCRLAAGSLLFFVLLSQPAYTHHSAAMFDLESRITIEGTVKKFQWTNPHVWIHIDVAQDAGDPVLWRIEYVAPNVLKRKGWKRTTFRKGDNVSITLNPAKSGDPKGWFVSAVLADGSAIGPGKDNTGH